MANAEASRLTALLADVRLGDEAARDELVTLVYPELKRIAARYMRQERPGHTLRTTGLIHEVYVRLFGATATDWQFAKAWLFDRLHHDPAS